MIIRLSETGSDRASAYITSNKIVRHGGRIYVGWLEAPRGPGELVPVCLAVIDQKTGEVLAKHVLGMAYDNHCGPALAMGRDGRLHFMVGAHHNPLLYRWSDDPLNLESWSAPVALGPFATYPSLIVDHEGTLHLLHRHMDQRWQLWYRRKPKDELWSPWVVLAEGPLPGYNHFYQSIVNGPNGSLHVLFQFGYTDTGSSADVKVRSVVYLQSSDAGKSWEHAGQSLNSPLLVDNVSPILHYPQGGIRISNLVVDQKNRPWFFVNFAEAPFAALYRYADKQWTRIEVPELLKVVSFEGGRESSLSLDSSGRMHLATATMPEGSSTWYDVRHEVYRAIFSEEGDLQSVNQVSPSDSGAANWLPALEHWDWNRAGECCAPTPALLYTKGTTAGRGYNINLLHNEVFLEIQE